MGRILEGKETISGLGLILKKPSFAKNPKLFNVFEGSLTHILSDSYKNGFKRSNLALGDELIELTIANFVSKGHYEYYKTIQMIRHFLKLRARSP